MDYYEGVMMRRFIVCELVMMLVVAVTGGWMEQAQASLITFFGEDLNGSNTRLGTTPNADVARDDFFSFLVNPGTENFEGFTDGITPTTLTFGAVTGTLTNITDTVLINDIPIGVLGGLYPISGDNILRQNTVLDGSFDIEFSTSLMAFGMFGIDVGDSSGELNITLHFTAGGLQNVAVPHNISDSSNAAVLYFGAISSDTTVTASRTSSWATTRQGTGFFTIEVASPSRRSPWLRVWRPTVGERRKRPWASGFSTPTATPRRISSSRRSRTTPTPFI